MSHFQSDNQACIPLSYSGAIKIVGSEINDVVRVPLATYESTLWPSVSRGAKVSMMSGGIRAEIIDERMTRSVLVDTPSLADALHVRDDLLKRRRALERVVAASSRFAKLLDHHVDVVGSTLFIRFEFTTGDASGHNMVTKASDDLLAWLDVTYAPVRCISVSGNTCVDKKVSAVNPLRGRGRKVIAELVISRSTCEQALRTTPERMVELNFKKNYVGSTVAGSLMTANAHFANMLLAVYLATGQDAANLVEGSQGMTTAELRDGYLYFAVTVPHIIVGTVGHGKQWEEVQARLRDLGCWGGRLPGMDARRLALITGAVVLCGELSLLAALSNPRELVQSHMQYERNRII